MPLQCCTQYARKFGKLSSSHRTGKGQFSFQFQRKAMPKKVQTTAQLHWSLRYLGGEDPLEKEMATQSNILAWRIPWTEEPGGLQSTGSQTVGHDWATSLSLSHTSKVMLKILQARLQQYVNHELSDVQAGFRKGRGARDQIASIHWIIQKQESSRKTSISVLLTMPKP